MTTPIRTARRTVPAAQPELPKVPWQGLFREAAYAGGEPYVLETDEDDGDEE